MQFSDYISITEAKENNIPSGVKKIVNDQLHQIGTKYWKSIPMKEIDAILKQQGITYQDDGFFLTGRDSRDSFELIYNGMPVSNSMLILTWYKMPSGNWEVVAYLS
jgi:hypothetical protein